ncbi:MAG: hypothetical protein HZB16_05010 [Armatimonadetes bacterium]|nr:hypothetical protein [Armatimonadota bacterium]
MFTRRTALGALAALMLMGAGARAVDEMPGQWGEVGKDYIMGKGHRLRFRLVSMEYRVDPVCIGKQAFAPKADEKLLVVHYVLQNAETTNRAAGAALRPAREVQARAAGQGTG